MIETARWTVRRLRIIAGLGMAAVAAGAWLLERRRGSRQPPRAAPPAAPAAVPPAKTPPDDSDPGQEPGATDGGENAPAPLSPWIFAISHFGLLVLLLAMMAGGLALRGIRRYPPDSQFHVNGGDPTRGRQAMVRQGCGGCHVIPGVPAASGRVGPSLKGYGQQMYIAGQLPNTPEHLIAWLQNPQRHAPGTAMPDLGVTEAEARDMASLLYAD